MSRAILLLDSDGVALAPATLCAEDPAEARRRNLPLLDQVLAELSAGMEIRPDGGSRYDLFEEGVQIGRIEVFESPSSLEKLIAKPQKERPPP
jgi:hypothetical protein